MQFCSLNISRASIYIYIYVTLFSMLKAGDYKIRCFTYIQKCLRNKQTTHRTSTFSQSKSHVIICTLEFHKLFRLQYPTRNTNCFNHSMYSAVESHTEQK